MKLISWLLVAVVGLGIMTWTYFRYMRLDAAAAWSSGLICLGDGPNADMPEATEFKHIATTVRRLPPSPFAAGLLQAVGGQNKDQQRSLAPELCEKLLLLDPKVAGIGDDALLSGRMPRAGGDEALAGYQTAVKDRLAVAGRDFAIVGVLRRDVALLADCYLVPPHDSIAPLFDLHDADNHPALMVELQDAEMRDDQVQEKLKKIFPPDKFASVSAMVRADRWPYYLYLLGEGLLLLGGSLALIALYRAMSSRIGWGVLRDPLLEIAGRPKLFGAVHLVYFGLVIAASAITYELPELQTFLLSTIKQSISNPNTTLGVAGEAYLSHNIPKAAALTFLINFFLGSIVCITLPSLIVPGSGTFMAVFRATLWGLLLGPVFVMLSLVMLPHSVTLLLEGEGYILAVFFGLLVPIYLFDRDKGLGVGQRYGNALIMNLKAMSLVALVLVIAACYEAVEVILMSK